MLAWCTTPNGPWNTTLQISDVIEVSSSHSSHIGCRAEIYLVSKDCSGLYTLTLTTWQAWADDTRKNIAKLSKMSFPPLFHDHIWNQHEKCTEISTNMASFGLDTPEIAPWNCRIVKKVEKFVHGTTTGSMLRVNICTKSSHISTNSCRVYVSCLGIAYLNSDIYVLTTIIPEYILKLFLTFTMRQASADDMLKKSQIW